MIIKNIDGLYEGPLVKKKRYPKGGDYVELEMTLSTRNYEPFEILRNTKGQRNGSLILKLNSRDYTKEHIQRKQKWKLSGRTGHLSKVYLCNQNKGWIDIPGTKDLGMVYVNTWKFEDISSMTILIAKGKKNDSGFLEMWLQGDFDPEIASLREHLKEGGN